MPSIYYLYPTTKDVSFTHIAKTHIRYMRNILKNSVRLTEGDIEGFEPTAWGVNRKIIVHPLFYPFFTGVTKEANARVNVIKICLDKGYNIFAFDTADSDRISEKAVSLSNLVDAVAVPSRFAKEAFLNSGVETKVYIIPHGVPDEFMNHSKKISHPDFLKLKKLKDNKKYVFVQFNLTHSGYRKGADLFTKAMSMVQSKNRNIISVVKRLRNLDPYIQLTRRLRCIEIGGYLNLDTYRQLYDLTDVMVLTSRGGGFEHNALEAMARGVPTLVPEAGCFMDYIKYAIPVNVTNNKPIVLPDNPIHTGRGWEIDVNELADRIIEVVDNLDEYKSKASKQMEDIWREYSWEKIVSNLVKILQSHGFIDGDKEV